MPKVEKSQMKYDVKVYSSLQCSSNACAVKHIYRQIKVVQEETVVTLKHNRHSLPLCERIVATVVGDQSQAVADVKHESSCHRLSGRLFQQGVFQSHY